jgi:hypothetical protein
MTCNAFPAKNVQFNLYFVRFYEGVIIPQTITFAQIAEFFCQSHIYIERRL